MLRWLIALVALELACVFSSAGDVLKKSQPEAPVAAASASRSAGPSQIDVVAKKIREAEMAHAPAAAMAQLYESLSSAFAKVGAYPQSQAALREAAALLRRGSQQDLAQVLGQLAVLDVAVGDVDRAVKDQMQALRIREKLGDAKDLALTWNDVAELNIRLGRFTDALTYARLAIAAVGEDAAVSARDRIAVRQTLGFALCGSGNAAEAVPVMKDALELAQTTSAAGSLDVGIAKYSLGYAYWQSGDASMAGKWMREGLTLMKANREWGGGPYLHAMAQYAKFLIEQGQTEAASSTQREIRMENSVVDVGALKAPPR